VHVCVCTGVSLANTAADREVRVTVSVSTQLEPCPFPHNVDGEGIEIPMCRVSVELLPHSPLSKVQVSVIVHPPLTVSQVSHTISSLCKLRVVVIATNLSGPSAYEICMQQAEKAVSHNSSFDSILFLSCYMFQLKLKPFIRHQLKYIREKLVNIRVYLLTYFTLLGAHGGAVG